MMMMFLKHKIAKLPGGGIADRISDEPYGLYVGGTKKQTLIFIHKVSVLQILQLTGGGLAQW